MAKLIKYQYLSAEINHGTEEEPVIEQFFFTKQLGFSEAHEAIAKREAYNGEYEIYDDGKPDEIVAPTQLDVIEAQVVYTAMMTDTLLEG